MEGQPLRAGEAGEGVGARWRPALRIERCTPQAGDVVGIVHCVLDVVALMNGMNSIEIILEGIYIVVKVAGSKERFSTWCGEEESEAQALFCC